MFATKLCMHTVQVRWKMYLFNVQHVTEFLPIIDFYLGVKTLSLFNDKNSHYTYLLQGIHPSQIYITCTQSFLLISWAISSKQILSLLQQEKHSLSGKTQMHHILFHLKINQQFLSCYQVLEIQFSGLVFKLSVSIVKHLETPGLSSEDSEQSSNSLHQVQKMS